MPTSRNWATTGVILVALGVLSEIAAYMEQPDLVQFSPNRFYTSADLRELEVAHQTLHEIQTGKDLLRQGDGSGDEQGASQADQADASQGADRTAMLAAAESKFNALQQKQDRAFRNQAIVSQTLKWVGIVLLVGAAVFLARTGRTRQATLVNTTPDNVPS